MSAQNPTLEIFSVNKHLLALVMPLGSAACKLLLLTTVNSEVLRN